MTEDVVIGVRVNARNILRRKMIAGLFKIKKEMYCYRRVFRTVFIKIVNGKLQNTFLTQSY